MRENRALKSGLHRRIRISKTCDVGYLGAQSRQRWRLHCHLCTPWCRISTGRHADTRNAEAECWRYTLFFSHTVSCQNAVSKYFYQTILWLQYSGTIHHTELRRTIKWAAVLKKNVAAMQNIYKTYIFLRKCGLCRAAGIFDVCSHDNWGCERHPVISESISTQSLSFLDLFTYGFVLSLGLLITWSVAISWGWLHLVTFLSCSGTLAKVSVQSSLMIYWWYADVLLSVHV